MSTDWPVPEDCDPWASTQERTKLMLQIFCPHTDVSKHRDYGVLRMYCNECGAVREEPVRMQY